MTNQKKYKKEILFLVTAAVLLIAGCQKKQEIPGEGPAQGLQTETEIQIGQEELAQTQQPSYVPVVSVGVDEANCYVENSDQILVSGYCELPMVMPAAEDEENRAIAEALDAWSMEQDMIFWDTVDQYETDAQDYLDSIQEQEDMEFYGFSTQSTLSYTRVDAYVLSFCYAYSDYTGGAHGAYGYQGVTFDTQTGEKLELSDLLWDKSSYDRFCEAASEYCVEKVKETYEEEGLSAGYETVIRDMISQMPNWYLDAAGIALIYNPGDLGPYAMGPVFVTLPYGEFSEMLRPEFAGLCGVGTAALPLNTEASVLLSAEAEHAEKVMLGFEVVDEEVWTTAITISAGKSQDYSEGFSSVRSAYLIRHDGGRVFLLFDVDLASDDYVTSVYELTDGEILKCYETDVSYRILPGYVNSVSVALEGRIDLLGTYRTKIDFAVTDEGALRQTTKLYTLDNDSQWSLLTTIRDLPVVINGEETILPAGSQIRVTSTDLDGTAWFWDETSQTDGEIHYTRGNEENSEWPVYIDGIEEYYYFEMLPYAG